MATDDVYSTYDAKARFSEVIRRVREGRTITVTYQGEPVAEIRPLDRSTGTAARMEWLRSRGVLMTPGEPQERHRFKTVAKRPGALERFLADRNE
jgi:prevent-host-death family protein